LEQEGGGKKAYKVGLRESVHSSVGGNPVWGRQRDLLNLKDRLREVHQKVNCGGDW